MHAARLGLDGGGLHERYDRGRIHGRHHDAGHRRPHDGEWVLGESRDRDEEGEEKRTHDQVYGTGLEHGAEAPSRSPRPILERAASECLVLEVGAERPTFD